MTLNVRCIANYCSPDEPPTGRDHERFLLTVPSTTQSRFKGRAISWTTPQTAKKYALHAIRSKQDDFKLTYQDRQRFKDAFETPRLDGKITKDPSRKAQ